MANADNPYGMTVGINPGDGNPGQPYAFWTLLLADLASLHCTWLRFQLSWRNIELTQGNYTWTVLDDAVQHCNAAGINILYTFRGAPNWALTTASQEASDEPWFIMDPVLAAGFATQVATRYDGHHGHGKIDRYGYNEDFNIHNTQPGLGIRGTFNEPVYTGLYGDGTPVTTGNKWQPARHPRYASPVAKAVYAAIKAANPSVLMGAPLIWWQQPINGGVPNTAISNHTAFITQLYADGCKGSMDFLDIHYYSNSVDPNTGSNQCATITQALADMRAAAVAAGDPLIPIYMTEYGWQVISDAGNETVQAARYNEVLPAIMNNNPNGKAFFFVLDYNHATTGASDSSSLVYWNGSQYVYRPAFSALVSFAQKNPQWAPVVIPPGGGGGPPPPPPPPPGETISDIGVVRYGGNDVNQGNPLSGGPRIYNMEQTLYNNHHYRPNLLQAIELDLTTIGRWIRSKL